MFGRQSIVNRCFSSRNIQLSRRNTNIVRRVNDRRIHTTIYVNGKSVNREDLGDLSRQNLKLSEQFDALKALTEQVQNVIKLKEEEKSKAEIDGLSVADKSTETTEQDIDEVFESLGILSGSTKKVLKTSNLQSKLPQQQEQEQSPNDTNSNITININNETDLMNLFPSPKPYVPLPNSITDILTPSILSNITQQETSNWEPIIDALLKSSICDPTSSTTSQESFTSFDFHVLVSSIPRNQKAKLVEKLHELALLSGVLWGNVAILNDLLALCNLLPKEQSHVLVTLLLRDVQMDDKKENNSGDNTEVVLNDDKIIANTTTKAILLNHYARLSDVNMVRKYIAILNELPDDKNPMKTSPVIYTSIMQMYMRMNNYNLAKETFDTMKFLSLSTSPSSRTYTSMILLDTLHNDIEHGISVYEEMVEKGLKVEPQVFLALAKGCGARKGMVSQGWDFILKYYEAGFPIDSHLMEIMMYLAYVDGDLPFVRGIWINICETNTKINGYVQLPDPKCTKWLFNSYYKIGDIVERAKNGHGHTPIGLVDARVSSIRSKVLELSNFQFHKDAPPLIPLKNFDGADPKLMLSEARALWKYILTTKGNENYIGEELIEAYLYVVGRYGLLEIFESEWDRLTFFDNEGNKKDDEEPKVTIEEPNQESNGHVEEDTKESQIAISKENQFPIDRIARTDRLYNMCMHIARHQASLAFAQKIWTERGEYRKTDRFQKTSITKQDEADFKFARLMLSALTHTGNVGDAYKLVLSSQNRFVWTKYHLKSLIQLCERMGYVTFTKELIKVTKRGNKWIRRQQK